MVKPNAGRSNPPALGDLELRHTLKASDVDAIRAIVEATGKFSAAEVEIALELVTANLTRGEESGYRFTVAEIGGQVVGYACYGPIPCTISSYDLYWIAVHPSRQGGGLGRQLVSAVETMIRQSGGTRVYIDTSGRAAYEPTRGFYEACGYRQAAVLPDFYSVGDPKVIYAKPLDRTA